MEVCGDDGSRTRRAQHRLDPGTPVTPREPGIMGKREVNVLRGRSKICGEEKKLKTSRKIGYEVGSMRPSSEETKSGGGGSGFNGISRKVQVQKAGSGTHSSSRIARYGATGSCKSSELNQSDGQSTYSVEQLREFAMSVKIARAVCSVKKGGEVRHGIIRREWFRGRCLMCSVPGHDASRCKTLERQDGGRGCYKCSLYMMDGQYRHMHGTYGNKDCPFQNLMRIALLCWEDKKLRLRLVCFFADLKAVHEEGGKLRSGNWRGFVRW